VTQEIVRLSLGPPSNTLGPIGDTSSVTSLVHGSSVVLLNLLWGEGGRLTRLGEFVVGHCCADGVGSREVSVFTGDTKVVTGGTVTDISLLGSGVDESVKVSEVFNADMRPDVGPWLLVRPSKIQRMTHPSQRHQLVLGRERLESTWAFDQSTSWRYLCRIIHPCLHPRW
jgi:hypothetical protein